MVTWRNGCFEKMDDQLVHTTPNPQPPKVVVLQKTFLQITHAALKYGPQPAASTFAFPSVFLLLLCPLPSGLIWNDLSPCLMSARDVGVANTRHIRQNILPRARKVHSCIYKAWDDDSLIVPSSSCIVLFFPTHSCSLSFSFYLMASPESRFLNFSWGLKTWVELGLPHEKLFGIFRTSKTWV